MTKSEHSHSFEIAGFTSVEPEIRSKLKHLISELIVAEGKARENLVEQIVEMVSSACENSITHPLYSDYSGLIIDYLLSFFLEVKSSHESEFYHFLSLLNHLPITHESPFFQIVLKSLKPYLDEEGVLLNLFNRLQMLYLLTDNYDFANAEKLYAELEPQIETKHLKLWVMLQICKARLLRHNNDLVGLLSRQLSMIVQAYQVDGCDCAINFLIRWIIASNWHKQIIIKKALLMRIHDKLGDHKNLNAAMVLFELFTMDERLVPSSEKIKYQKRLIKFPGTILNVQQVHSLYFFAGNYNCGVLSQFKDSINNYQYSNYYLHKSWERLLCLSRFMREQLDPDTYYAAMPYLDTKIKDLSNQASLQNNAYVESLQANFDTIDELYEKVAELSLTDSMTGLRNRRFLDGNLFQIVVLAARQRVPVCFTMIDIDFFKHTNDTYGHLAGDYVLKELARMLLAEFRKSDIVVRYGGEEFLVILFDSDMQRSVQIMDEFRAKVQSHSFEYRNNVIPTTISIGLTCDFAIEPQEKDLVNSISRADKALYKAKTTGRNRVEVFSHRQEAGKITD